MTLMPVAEAQRRLLALKSPLEGERVALADANRRYLAEPLVASRSQPAADLSAMDGYAIRFADLAGPWTIVGESRAGGGALAAIGAGEAAPISTGAALPDGADAILIRENAHRAGTVLTLAGDPPDRAGLFVRPRASDFVEGDRLAPAGTRVTPQLFALSALAGHDALAVHRRPRVALLSTGEEIARGTLPDANAPMLAALFAAAGAEIVSHETVGDDRAATAAALRRAASADLIVATGGVSVGEHDHVRPAFESIGGCVDFWRIAMRPGKPLVAGVLGEAAFLGLPGNPVSAFVTALLFALPMARHLAGSADPLPLRLVVRTATALPPNGSRETYLRAVFDGSDVTPLPDQDSAATLALARANALIIRPVDAKAVEAGASCEMILLD